MTYLLVIHLLNYDGSSADSYNLAIFARVEDCHSVGQVMVESAIKKNKYGSNFGYTCEPTT